MILLLHALDKVSIFAFDCLDNLKVVQTFTQICQLIKTLKSAVPHSLVHSFHTCARQAQQAQSGMYWNIQLSPISSILRCLKSLILIMEGGEVLIQSCLFLKTELLRWHAHRKMLLLHQSLQQRPWKQPWVHLWTVLITWRSKMMTTLTMR